MSVTDTKPKILERDPTMYGVPKHKRHKNDAYDTPADVASILEQEPLAGLIRGKEIWEPAGGAGALFSAIMRAGACSVTGTDIEPRHESVATLDFLDATEPLSPVIVTNPPFSLSDQFVETALSWMTSGCLDTLIVLSRWEWATATRRWAVLDRPDYGGCVALSWRPRWIAGTTGSPRTNYCWHWWSHESQSRPAQIVFKLKPKGPELETSAQAKLRS